MARRIADDTLVRPNFACAESPPRKKPATGQDESCFFSSSSLFLFSLPAPAVAWHIGDAGCVPPAADTRCKMQPRFPDPLTPPSSSSSHSLHSGPLSSLPPPSKSMSCRPRRERESAHLRLRGNTRPSYVVLVIPVFFYSLQTPFRPNLPASGGWLVWLVKRPGGGGGR